jgi:Flp pilus assembly protein TadG
MQRMVPHLKNTRGQSITELALILPLILVLISGVVDFGLAFFIGHELENAAREGARSAAVQPTDPAASGDVAFPGCQSSSLPIISAACNTMPNIGLFDGFTVSNTAVTGSAPNKAVIVTATGTYSWFLLQLIPASLPLLGDTGFPSSPITIIRSATMRREWNN